jgi:hypothetical protein
MSAYDNLPSDSKPPMQVAILTYDQTVLKYLLQSIRQNM